MRYGGKVICPSCPQAHGFLKLQPNSMTNSPSPGFAIAENPEHISKAHFKFDFSLASAASIFWVCGEPCDCPAELLTPPQSAWAARGELAAARAHNSSLGCPAAPGAGTNQEHILAKGTPARRQAPAETSPLEGLPFELKKGWVLRAAIFKFLLSNTRESIY